MTARGSSGWIVPLVACAALLLPAAARAGDAAAGKGNYDMFCSTCHGAGGKGDGPAGVALDPPPRDLSAGEFKFDADGDGTAGSDADLALVIKNGAAAYGGNVAMVAWAQLTDEQVADLVAYIRTLAK